MTAVTEDIISRALPGATDHGEGVVTFALYAPRKKTVHLSASFNDWDWHGWPLEQREEGFWVASAQLPRGKCEYQFVVDGSIVICDPYAQEINVAPGEEPRAVIDVGRPIYQWENEHWQRPNLRDLIVYEMHVGDFSPEGTFQGVIDRLDYLQDLGINCIEFMPLYESVPRAYWGYEPNYFLAVRKSYGPMEDLLRLIDAAHGRGIAVILDMVLNHTGHHHPFMKLYPWDESPWYGNPIGEPNQFGLPTLDFTKPATNAFVRDVQAYWLRVFHIDGFRYDYLAGLGANKDGQGLPYLMRTARDIRPEAYLFGECIPEDPDLTRDSGLSGVWHTRFRIAIECLIRERDEEPYKWDDFEATVRSFDPTTQCYHCGSFMLNYGECHDDIRIIRSLRDEIGFPEDVAYRKSALAATILMTVPGEPMLWQGQEWGEATVRQQKPNKIHWEVLETDEGRCLRQHYADMVRLRRERTSTRTDNFAFDLIDAARRVVVYHRWLGDADQVLVAANFSREKQTVTIEFPAHGPWRNRSTHDLLNVTGSVELTLEPYCAVVFTSGVS
ncbi:MAG TPA: alpha-amylase family glycosyl hydrolase [Phycisphaerae bacterium]|nr:alpha-amylase family glycosyl hydrolase [Phycisphaerae bacterium]